MFGWITKAKKMALQQKAEKLAQEEKRRLADAGSQQAFITKMEGITRTNPRYMGSLDIPRHPPRASAETEAAWVRARIRAEQNSYYMGGDYFSPTNIAVRTALENTWDSSSSCSTASSSPPPSSSTSDSCSYSSSGSSDSSTSSPASDSGSSGGSD